MGIFSSLKRDQREAIGLLQVGTFLEYFDLMLYVHMAVLLNSLFFPETDPHTAALLSAFAFCSTYVLRPFGALLFGYIGDNIGRKATVILTTMMMAVSCIIMATLPTYAQIGIGAAWFVTLCRMLQGLSSMGEIIGAEIYLTEITHHPVRYPIVALIGCASRFGTMIALGVAVLVISFGLNWRTVFLVGACIAIIGAIARVRLQETPDFVNKKQQQKEQFLKKQQDKTLTKTLSALDKEDVSWKTIIAFFMISSGPPVCLYFSYIYCSNILKNLGYSGEYIINQNFLVSVVEFLAILFTAILSYKINPLKIIKIKSLLFLPFVCIVPYLIYHANTSFLLFSIQFVSVCLILTGVPAVAALVTHFPVFKRVTYTSLAYALSRALMYIVTSFGLVYLTKFLGHWGICFIMVPVTLGLLWGVSHFRSLEKASNLPALSL